MEAKGKRSQMCVVAVIIKVLLTSIYLTVKVHFQLWPTHLNVFFFLAFFACGYSHVLVRIFVQIFTHS